MKLYDLAMCLGNPEQKVVLKNAQERKICFEGNADQLLDYSGINYRRVKNILIQKNVLVIYV